VTFGAAARVQREHAVAGAAVVFYAPVPRHDAPRDARPRLSRARAHALQAARLGVHADKGDLLEEGREREQQAAGAAAGVDDVEMRLQWVHRLDGLEERRHALVSANFGVVPRTL